MAKFDPQKHQRQSTRLKGFDYTQSGAYFVTRVTHQREPFFDDAVLQKIAEAMWLRIPKHFDFVKLDEWVVMPNHIHGILWIRGRDDAFSRETRSIGTTDTATMPINIGDLENASPLRLGPASGSIGAIVGNFKSISARRINRVRSKAGAKIWQRNYHDRIIRNDKELNAIRQYISDNPAKWVEDAENPNRSM